MKPFSFFGISTVSIDLDYCYTEWFAFGTKRSFYHFWECISDSFVDYAGYSISSKGFLPTVVDIKIIWIKFSHSKDFSSLIPKISMLTLAISCLTTSNLPWFMDLTFQVAMQYCSLRHRTLLSPLDTFTAGHCFCFGSVSSLLLELLLSSSPVAYWALTDLGSSSFSIISFCLFIIFMVFSRQEYWSGLSFPSPVDHVLSKLSTMTCLVLGGPTWHGSLFHWSRQGCDPSDQFCWFSVNVVFILSPLWWMRIRGSWKLRDGRDWLWGKLALSLMGKAMLSKSLIQFSVDGWGCVPSLLFTWGHTMS